MLQTKNTNNGENSAPVREPFTTWGLIMTQKLCRVLLFTSGGLQNAHASLENCSHLVLQPSKHAMEGILPVRNFAI